MKSLLSVFACCCFSIATTKAEENRVPERVSQSHIELFRGTQLDERLQKEYEFLVTKYAEYSMESAIWFTHVFNPSHTQLIFISLEPPAGRNTYHFYVYEKKNLDADGTAIYHGTKTHQWLYKGEYVFSSPTRNWWFNNIIFEEKTFSIIIKTEREEYKHSFDYSKSYDELII